MYVCVVDQSGKVLLHRNMPAGPQAFLEAIKPYRDGVVVGVECMYCWYWLADVCAEEGIEFTLGHALYMKAIHGAKAKNDKIDSHKLAMMLKGGVFPISYVYPREMRALRDLMRRRLFFVHRRAELLAHVQMTFQQFNFPEPGQKLAYRANREKLELPFKDKATTAAVEADLAMPAFESMTSPASPQSSTSHPTLDPRSRLKFQQARRPAKEVAKSEMLILSGHSPKPSPSFFVMSVPRRTMRDFRNGTQRAKQ